MAMRRAIFIDKDGTLIQDIPYNVDPGLIRFNKGAVEALQKMKALGFLLIVVSNQSGVARGYFDESALLALKDHLMIMLKEHGVGLDAIYFCPHHPDGKIVPYNTDCSCRKPKPGMLLRAAETFGIDLAQSWMIGDILNDVEAGNRAGCKTMLLNNGNETEWEVSQNRRPTVTISTFAEAAEIIIHQRQMV
jgi:D-glycero-D-manno-heptose 1,7-bisphosphate phosphatase